VTSRSSHRRSGRDLPRLSVAGVVLCLLAVGAVFAFAAVKQSQRPEPPRVDRSLPAQVLDLTNWRLALPTGKDDADQVDQPELATFQDKKYFHVNKAQTGVVFRANAGGTTTDGSKYPRSELREMKDDGDDEASWSSESGVHTMTITEAITSLPQEKPQVVAGQIHDDEDDVVMIRLEKSRLFVEADGDEVGLLDKAYALGTKFTVIVQATDKGIRVTYNGRTTVTYDKTGDDWYFKAGCYTQSNEDEGDAADAYGEVVIYDLKVTHQN
jgi:hypothetical protein